MQPLPYFTEYKSLGIMSATELDILVAMIYFIVLCFTIQLIAAIHNIYAFLIK